MVVEAVVVVAAVVIIADIVMVAVIVMGVKSSEKAQKADLRALVA